MMPDHGASAPLLPSTAASYYHHHHHHHNLHSAAAPPHDASASTDDLASHPADPTHDESPAAAARRHVAHLRKTGRRLLNSRKKHYLVMAVVTLDAAALLANVFIRLIACEMRQRHEPWVQAVTSALETAALTISCLFMLELAACLFAYGLRYALDSPADDSGPVKVRLADPASRAAQEATFRTGSTSSTRASLFSASSSTLASAASQSPLAPSSSSFVCGAWPRYQKRSSWVPRSAWSSSSITWRN